MLPASLLVLLVPTLTSALYAYDSHVISLTPWNFDKEVMESSKIWVVEFFAPWCAHCRNLVPEYESAAKALKGTIEVGAVDVHEHQDLGARFGVQGFPTIKIFSTDKQKPEVYSGPRTAEGIVIAALDVAKAKAYQVLRGGKSKSKTAKDVIELTNSNFDGKVLDSQDLWMVMFYAPWCGHCKNLWPQWEQAATQLKGKVKFGALDATTNAEKSQEYSVRGYPTVYYFPAGTKSRYLAEEYSRGRSKDDIVAFALEKLAENTPSPGVLQIVDDAVFENACKDRVLCVISFLPHILDCQSSCRNEFLDILANMTEKFKMKMWGWLWAESGNQPELEEALGVGGFGYPAMVVLNVDKMKFTLLRGSFSYEGITEFLRDLSYGKGGITALVKGGKLPKIAATEPWNGQDGVLPIEDDIDLSDVNLDEKVEL